MKIRERVNKSKSFEMDTYKMIKLLKTKKNVLTCKLNVCLLFMHTVYIGFPLLGARDLLYI